MRVSKNEGVPLLTVPILRVIAYWGLFGGQLIDRNCRIRASQIYMFKS